MWLLTAPNGVTVGSNQLAEHLLAPLLDSHNMKWLCPQIRSRCLRTASFQLRALQLAAMRLPSISKHHRFVMRADSTHQVSLTTVVFVLSLLVGHPWALLQADVPPGTPLPRSSQTHIEKLHFSTLADH